MTTRNNFLPPGLVSNLQDVLNKKNKNNNVPVEDVDNDKKIEDESTSTNDVEEYDPSKPVIFVTNSDGIDSPGLLFLVEAIVNEGLFNVSVCAPQLDKSYSGHSYTHQETIEVTTAEIKGASAYQISGTPVDCVSLALSGALFAWSKPSLVIVGVNKGTSCGHDMLTSSAVAGARQALISGIPSLSFSLDWKKGESEESHFKDAVSVCMPVIKAAIRDVEKGVFPKSSSLHITVPASPAENKGFKLTKQSLWRSKPIWQAIAANRMPPAARFANQHGMGLQLAQLGRDASAAGAARRLGSQKKSLEVVESVGVSGKVEKKTVRYFRLEFQDSNEEDTDENLDFRALQDGFVSVTPISVSTLTEPDIENAASEWISGAL
ncbi:survival protein SurE-like phosphatase/nucleotidase [Artemisia annua]|uniref:Survival protein SurE-like phosphatase/nucleotidase n=1 Tax=Artemisia annua TaxID=35608 RepID=A0A2U1KAJ5_ARTAN|nr:survival protein SurE-like phosphatase/nucleotidase [Artemisia annua]